MKIRHAALPLIFSFCAMSPLPGYAITAAGFSKANIECTHYSEIYGLAASLRDAQQSPQATLKRTQKSFKKTPPIFLKQIINNVYFDPDYRNIPGQFMQSAVFNQCIHDLTSPHFTPLK